MGKPIDQLCITHKCYALKIVAISIFMYLKRNNYVFLRIWFSSQEKKILAITPPKQMQSPLFYW